MTKREMELEIKRLRKECAELRRLLNKALEPAYVPPTYIPAPEAPKWYEPPAYPPYEVTCMN